MGNGNSTQSPKTPKDRKTEDHGSADTARKRRTSNANDKTAGRTSQDFNRQRIGPRTTNPFLIFFLRLRSEKPNEHVTVIARAAGKLWARMTPEQRKKYVDLANAEKKRRQDRKQKRKRPSAYSRTN